MNEGPNWNSQEDEDDGGIECSPSGGGSWRRRVKPDYRSHRCLGSTPVDPEPFPTQSEFYTCRTASAIDDVRHWPPA